MQIDVGQVIFSKNPKLKRYIPRFVINRIEKIIHQDELNEILMKYGHLQGVDFVTSTLKHLKITYRAYGFEKLDRNRRYIIVSNHPLGGLDGMVIIEIFGRIFEKVKFVVNDLLYHVEPLKPIFLPVNKFGKQSQEAAKKIDESYRSDDQILYFPAGLCSRLIHGGITDLPWKKSYLTQALKYERDILPIYIGGANSRLFYRFAKLRAALGIKFNIEQLLLPHEMFKKSGSSFDIYAGDPIPYRELVSRPVAEWNGIIRQKVYSLKDNRWSQ